MNNCISKEDYKTKGRKITDLPNLDDIYDVCMLYEEYKKGKYFDIQDIVNFLIRQVKLELKDVKLIDYLFIDEIQDLTVSQIYLLILVSKHCKIYAGDTCQTISKINRFRFSELNNIFYAFGKVIPNYPKVNNAYLCLNFRLNSKILRLSTFMAYLMKLLFPNTLDKFQDDFSIKIIEQKPIYLKNIDLIIDTIKNSEKSKDYTLVANHCFIYNNEKDGELLNNLYGDKIYKLNVEQSKGLEFEMVICYNFFTSSKFQNLWEKIFKNITEEKKNYCDSINSSSIIKLESILNQENINYLIETLHLRNIYPNSSDEEIHEKLIQELNTFIYPKLNVDFDIHEIFEFCSEIKKFYVIITRPKTFLVFYETNLNKGRDGFYELMKSKSIDLIVEEENGNNTQNQFLNNAFNYFINIDLKVKTPEELRILGNNEFNEKHYSRAIYLYKESKSILLEIISNIFYNEEILNYRINTHEKNDSELKSLNEKIVNDIKPIIEKHKEINLNNFIEEDNNRINISNIIEQFIIFLGKSLIFLQRYDEVIELYKENNKINELGMVYYNYKKDYILSFECFNSICNYKYSINSLIKIGNMSDVFNYVNEKAINLGIISYNDIYLNYINDYFRKFSIERKKLNEDFLNKLKIEEKKGLTNKKIIYNYFMRYLFQINRFQNKNNIEIFDDETFKDLKNELKLNYNTINFVEAYYFNTNTNLLIELLKLFPELIFFKSKSFDINDSIKKYRENKKNHNQNNIKLIDKENIYYNNLKVVIDYFLTNSEYKNEQKFQKYIIPFLINHGYFYFELDKYFANYSKEIKLFFDLALNNYDSFSEIEIQKIIKKMKYLHGDDNDNLLYYLSYLLRVGITNFIKRGNDMIFNILANKYNFKILYSLINKYFFSFENLEQNINILLDYLINEEIILTRDCMINLLDIGSSMSLLLIICNKKYFNNFTLKDEYFILDMQSLFRLFQKLYQLCNLISSTYINSFSYNKKLILFSLFSAYNVSPIPFNDKFLDKKIFKIFNSINGCLLNINSILFDLKDKNKQNKDKKQNKDNKENKDNKKNKENNDFFDIFSSDNFSIFEQNFEILNIEGNNIVINYNVISTLFRLMLSSLVKTFFDINYDNLKFTPNIFSDENQLNLEGHYYSDILYYYDQLYLFYNESNKENSLFKFWNTISHRFSHIGNYFPREDEDESFNIDYYFKDLLLYYNIKPNILYSFLINYLHIQNKGNNISNNENDIFLLIFLLKDIWNINFSSNDYYDQNLSLYYFEKLNLCLDYINKGDTYIFSSILILRRIYILIIQLFEFYLENYIKNNNSFDSERSDINIFSFEQENIFDYIRNRNILHEIEFYEDSQERILQIIRLYYSALRKIIIKFSEFEDFCKDEESNVQNSNENEFVKILKIIGKGKYETEEERKDREDKKRKEKKEKNKKNEKEERKEEEAEEKMKKEDENNKKVKNEKNLVTEDKNKNGDIINNIEQNIKKENDKIIKENEENKKENIEKNIKIKTDKINDENKKEKLKNNIDNKKEKIEKNNDDLNEKDINENNETSEENENDNTNNKNQKNKKKKNKKKKNKIQKEEKEEKDKIEVKKNAIVYYDQIIYSKGIKKLIKNKLCLEEIKGTLENEYEKNNYKIKEITNEYFYLFEIIFFCIYLDSLELFDILEKELETNLDEKAKENLLKIREELFEFIKTYENNSLYFNFIDEEGHKTYIRKKYDEIYYKLLPKNIKLYNQDYKDISSLRKFFLLENQKKFKFYYNEEEMEIQIIKKSVNFCENRDIKKICGIIKDNDKMWLINSFNENSQFFIGPNAEKVRKFFKKIDFDNIDENEKNNIFNNYIENYLSILGK